MNKKYMIENLVKMLGDLDEKTVRRVYMLARRFWLREADISAEQEATP